MSLEIIYRDTEERGRERGKASDSESE